MIKSRIENLYGDMIGQLIDKSTLSHQPISISSDKNNAVPVAEEDWLAIQETLYLLLVPNMRESIREGMATPVKQCSRTLGW